jgi:hypothetical protein
MASQIAARLATNFTSHLRHRVWKTPCSTEIGRQKKITPSLSTLKPDKTVYPQGEKLPCTGKI